MARKLDNGTQDISMRDELEQIGGMISHLSKRAVDEGQDKMADQIGELRRVTDDLLKRTNSKAQATFDTATTQVREHPVGSIISAFAIGALLAALFSRR